MSSMYKRLKTIERVTGNAGDTFSRGRNVCAQAILASLEDIERGLYTPGQLIGSLKKQKFLLLTEVKAWKRQVRRASTAAQRKVAKDALSAVRGKKAVFDLVWAHVEELNHMPLQDDARITFTDPCYTIEVYYNRRWHFQVSTSDLAHVERRLAPNKYYMLRSGYYRKIYRLVWIVSEGAHTLRLYQKDMLLKKVEFGNDAAQAMQIAQDWQRTYRATEYFFAFPSNNNKI